MLDASSDATTADVSSETLPNGDAGWIDANAEDVASIVLEGGGPFLCLGCICNGADHECVELGHVIPMSPIDGGFGDAAACDPEAGPSGCTPIPSQCLPTPSCACVLQYAPFPGCGCELDPSGSGILVVCLLP